MTPAEICMPLMLLVTIGAIAPAKIEGRREYDNANPRDPGFYRTGFRQRAQGAHQNSYECLPFFFAAVLLAEFRAAPQGLVDALAVGFVALRVLYVLCYWSDRPTARSIVWAAALACNLALFLLPAWGR